jgi:outer membrane receptor for monomeric catechols
VPSGNQEEAAAAFDTEITEFYIEDTIDVSDILTVSLGVRIDTAETITPLTYTPAFFDFSLFLVSCLLYFNISLTSIVSSI